jgi:hypothetical protein
VQSTGEFFFIYFFKEEWWWKRKMCGTVTGICYTGGPVKVY